MHTLKLASALAVGLLSAAGVSAAEVTLDFNGVTNYGSVADFYNGGTDYAGASGTNYGVSFTGSVLSLANDELSSPLLNSPTTTVIQANPGDVEAVMNVTGGFANALGLTYAAGDTTTIKIYSGLNATGDLLASFDLSSNLSGCDAGVACMWNVVSESFAGIAKSVDFTSNAGAALYTDIKISSVPLPPSIVLMTFGVAGLGLFGARRRAA